MKSKKQLSKYQIFKLLKKHLSFSYAIYSHFHVCSILESYDGKYFYYYFGNNIENNSYSLTICAERNAIFNFLSNKTPQEKILNLYVLGTDSKQKYQDIIYPCGACLQVIKEFFNQNNHIFCYSISMKLIKTKINNLMPSAFNWKGKK